MSQVKHNVRDNLSPRVLFGDCPLSRFNIEAVGILRDRKAATPEAANNRVKRLRAMFKWALEKKLARVTANPAREVSKLKPKRKCGFPVWKPAELDKFEAHHPIGTRPRLALALLSFTGARRSDVVRLGGPWSATELSVGYSTKVAIARTR